MSGIIDAPRVDYNRIRKTAAEVVSSSADLMLDTKSIKVEVEPRFMVTGRSLEVFGREHEFEMLLDKNYEVLHYRQDKTVTVAKKKQALCKRVAMLRCSRCGKNLCNKHAVGACCYQIRHEGMNAWTGTRTLTMTHIIDNITATVCTEEVEL